MCQCHHHIKIPKGANAARARAVLIVKKLNNSTLNILVSNLFFDRQHPVWYLIIKIPKLSVFIK